MPKQNTVIIDTSVLIAFEKLEKSSLLCLIYDEILLTEAVYQEYQSNLQHCFSLKTAPMPLTSFLVNNVGLGRGESESIALAYHTGIKVLIDDLKARKFAVELGCSLSGTIGVLYKMEQKETIDSAFKEIIKLKELGFRISEKLIHKLSSK